MKRVFDFIAAYLALLTLFPLLLLIAILVRVRIGSPALFRQKRPGRHGRIFTLVKFRTMTNQRDASGNLLPDALRITPLGAWLRATSLDELPELWNVLVGDMSLVGPRPLLVRYLPRYNARQARRHEMRPGITGWAQINGRNALDWKQKLELDVWYVENQSFMLDIKILCKTLAIVLRRDGITHAEHASMPEFMGTEGEARTIKSPSPNNK